MQNHLEITSKSKFWIRNVQIERKPIFNLILRFFWPPDNVFGMPRRKTMQNHDEITRNVSLGFDMCEI